MMLYASELLAETGKAIGSTFKRVLPYALLLACLGGSYYAGWSVRDSHARADAAKAETAKLSALLQDADYNAKLAGDYVLRRAATEFRVITLKEKVPHVVTHYIPSPGAAPVPAPQCVFTNGYVGLWNDALVQLPAGTLARPSDRDTAGSEEELFDSGISQADVLNNHIDNAAIAAQVRNQCEGLLAAARRYQERQ